MPFLGVREEIWVLKVGKGGLILELIFNLPQIKMSKSALLNFLNFQILLPLLSYS